MRICRDVGWRRTSELVDRLHLFQKQLKYGLQRNGQYLYELGFSDRVISQDLAMSLNLSETHRKDLVNALRNDHGMPMR